MESYYIYFFSIFNQLSLCCSFVFGNDKVPLGDHVFHGEVHLLVVLSQKLHLFDIDLRIRWTIKQSTLAAVFVTLIFLISEGADRYLSAELGDFAGLLAAAIVVFFLAPLQRLAERVASAAMPNTENTPEYTAYRKMQVYEAAVSEALPDGNISVRERALLNSLRDSLGISTADAEALERELKAVSLSQ